MVDISHLEYKHHWMKTPIFVEATDVTMGALSQFMFNNKDLQGIAFKKDLRTKKDLLVDLGFFEALHHERLRLWNVSIDYYYIFNANNINDYQLATALHRDIPKFTQASWYVWLNDKLTRRIPSSMTCVGLDEKRMLFLEWSESQILPFLKRMKQRGELIYDGVTYKGD